MNTTFYIWIFGYLKERIATKLFVNTICILNFAIACYRLPYLVHINYCLGFSTCLYYKLRDFKIALLKFRSTGKKVTSKYTLYKTQIK